MKNIYFLLVFAIFSGYQTIAQSVSTIYSADLGTVCPALVGLQPDYTVAAYSEQSFSSKSLSEQTVRFTSPLLKKGGMLVDVQRSSRNIFNQFNAKAAYAHHLFLSESLTLNFALGGFYTNNTLYQSNLNDFERLDPVIASYSDKNVNQYGGLFSVAMRSSRITLGSSVYYNIVSKKYFYNALGSYDIYLSPSFVLVPYVYSKNDDITSFIPGIGTSLWYKKCVWLTVDMSKTSSAAAGCFISKFLFLSYSYKVSTSSLWLNTHTFSLGLKLGKSMFNGILSSGDKSAPYYEWEK